MVLARRAFLKFLFGALLLPENVAQSRSIAHLRSPARAKRDVPLGDDQFGLSEVFVDADGSDNAAGSERFPKRTLAAALLAVRPGGTVYIRGGQYVLRTKLLIQKPVTLRAYPGESPVVDGLGVLANLLEVYDASGVVIQGIRWRGANSNPESASGAVTINQSSQVVVRDCAFENNAATGFEIGASRQVEVRNCAFNDNGLAGLATWGSASNLLVEGSSFRRNNQRHFDMYDRAAGAKFNNAMNSVVRNCTFEENQSTGLWCDNDCRNMKLDGNELRNNRLHGIHYEISSEGYILRNTVVGSQAVGVLVANSIDCEVSRNLFLENSHAIDVAEQSNRSQQTLRGIIMGNAFQRNARALSIYKLHGGSISSMVTAINNSRYVGEPTNRWGNTFAHSLASWQRLSGCESRSVVVYSA